MGAEEHGDGIVIQQDRDKLGWVTAGAAAFVAMAPLIVWSARTPSGPPAALAWLVALADVPFFGYCFLVGLRRLLHPAPALVLDAEGLHDASSELAAGSLRWDEILMVYRGRIQFQQFLCIRPHDVEGFIARQPPAKRKLMRANMALVGAPVAISAVTLPIGLGELEAMIEERMAGASVRGLAAPDATV